MRATHTRPRNTLAVLALLIPILVISCDSDGNREMFNRFSASVSSNTNLPRIVSWARGVLADTNNPPILEHAAIDQSSLPRELFNLYHGPNAEAATPLVAVHSPHSGDPFVSVTYLPGSVFLFSLFIGGEHFSIPPESVKLWKKLDDGVFVALDWPGK